MTWEHNPSQACVESMPCRRNIYGIVVATKEHVA